ncbi:hypothetical protein [Cupriavidus campinensis]
MKKTLALTMVSAAVAIAACGGGSDGTGVSGGSGGTPDAAPASNMAPLEAACLATPVPGQTMTATVNVGPITEVVTLTAKGIGPTTFDGESRDTLEVKINGSLMNTRSKDFRIYTSYSPFFPGGVIEYGHPGMAGIPDTKYRRFTYRDSTTGEAAMLNLVGMTPNETRTFTMDEYHKSAPSTAPQPAFSSTPSRTVRLTIQYIGREDVSAMGKAYPDACKIKVRYERDGNTAYYSFPTLESTIWLARGFGPVKMTGAPLLGVETIAAETSGIIGLN